MKVLVLGNAGAGKSTLCTRLAVRYSVPSLSLDDVAFQEGAVRRPLRDSVEEVERWMADKPGWVIEGCYADILEPILAHCDELIFLNPGVEVCVAHCRSRPWEPEKFGSRQEQDSHLEHLVQWVQSYETRTDEYGLFQHRRIFSSFQGKKSELHDPGEYGAV